MLLAEDENGEVKWAYRTIAAKLILARDKSVDKEVLERLLSERMLDLPYESTEELKKLGTMKQFISWICRQPALHPTASDTLPVDRQSIGTISIQKSKGIYTRHRQRSKTKFWNP